MVVRKMIKTLFALLKNVGKPFNSAIGGEVANITVFSGEKIPMSGLYGIIKHEKACDKLLPSERHMWMRKGELAHKPIVCQHEVIWKLLGKI